MVLDVEVGELRLSDGATVGVVGGCYLNDPKCLSIARELATLRAENASFRSSAVPPPPWAIALIVAVAAASFAGGFIYGQH